MKIPSAFLAGAWTLFLLVGCRTRSTDSLAPETTKYSIESSGKFARLDIATQDAIICTGLQERLNQAGHLEIVVNVKNRTAREIQVRVRCVFKDDDGFTTGDETAWQPVALGDEATEAVRFTASNALAKKYTVVVSAR